MEDTGNPWKVLTSKEVFDTPWIKVTKYDVLNPAGKEGIYGVVSFKNLAIGILPLDEEYNTCIVGQYRFPTNHYSWEIIEGGGPHDVDPIESAKRELLEEAGIKAEEFIPLITDMHLSNSATNERALVYIARKLSFHESEPEETEQLTVKKIPFEQLYQMVMNETVKDAITVAAVLKTKILIDKKAI